MLTPVVSYITFWFAMYEEQTCDCLFNREIHDGTPILDGLL